MSSPKVWYILDVLHQVYGPYPTEEVKRMAGKNPNFFVGLPGDTEWLSVDSVPELMDDAESDATKHHGMGEPLPHQLQRAVDELMGICKGIISDGVVTPEETRYLDRWLKANTKVSRVWPADAIGKRLGEILADGVVTPEEQEDLLTLLNRITGDQPELSQVDQIAKRIPFDHPEPEVRFANSEFSLVGRFLFGTRMKCEEAIQNKGGRVVPHPERTTQYMVVGSLAIEEWLRKSGQHRLDQVLDMKQQGLGPAIITEEHWCAHLFRWD
ncbi:MAG: GYF domain-containing protein [Deltaproteobacteria bacterium]|nr:GYF domain-containing protein [Deltaproteobacteria bacterium]